MPEHMHVYERPTPLDPMLSLHWRCVRCGDVKVAPGERYITIPRA